jgi:hypothetical protein
MDQIGEPRDVRVELPRISTSGSRDRIGSRVRVANLQSHAELNGRMGVVTQAVSLPSGPGGGVHSESGPGGEYVVNVDGVGERRLGAGNLEWLQQPTVVGSGKTAGGMVIGYELVSKQPRRVRSARGQYALNFKGRVTKASVKNFQLVHGHEDQKNAAILLQFGKIDIDKFIVDFQHPITPFQAFAMVISKFDTGN